MKPVNFPQKNLTLVAEGCGDLPVSTNGQSCTSVWELSDDELEHVLMHRKVGLTVIAGGSQPPVSINCYDEVKGLRTDLSQF